jgi:hypothetical protein
MHFIQSQCSVQYRKIPTLLSACFCYRFEIVVCFCVCFCVCRRFVPALLAVEELPKTRVRCCCCCCCLYAYLLVHDSFISKTFCLWLTFVYSVGIWRYVVEDYVRLYYSCHPVLTSKYCQLGSVRIWFLGTSTN